MPRPLLTSPPGVIVDSANPFTPNWQRKQSPKLEVAIFAALASVMVIVIFVILYFWRESRRRAAEGAAATAAEMVLPTSAQIRALNEAEIQALPRRKFHAADPSSSEPHECCIYVSAYEEDDGLVVLPACSHTFHQKCIVDWLTNHGNCPNCRHNYTISGSA